MNKQTNNTTGTATKTAVINGKERKEESTMTKTTKQATNPNKTTFNDLVKEYNNKATNNRAGTEFTNALYTLAKATTFSVLRKIETKSADPMIIRLKQALAKDLALLDNTRSAANNAYTVTIDNNGDYNTTITDKKAHNDLDNLIGQSLSDGYELVTVATVAILEQTNAQRKRDGNKPIDLERPFEHRRLKKKVVIKSADSVGAWETVITMPIKEVFKAVRRAVQESSTVQSASAKYCYIDDLTTDGENGTEERIYRRLDAYTDMVNDPCAVVENAVDGQPKDARPNASQTTDLEIVNQTEILVESLNLTARQALILKYRQRGYGYKAIAMVLGVSAGTVQKQVNEIRRKAIAAGLKPKAK